MRFTTWMVVRLLYGGGVGGYFLEDHISPKTATVLLASGLVLAIPATILVCSLVGLVNGVLVGYFRLRAFLTTLVTLIIVRGSIPPLRTTGRISAAPTARMATSGGLMTATNSRRP